MADEGSLVIDGHPIAMGPPEFHEADHENCSGSRSARKQDGSEDKEEKPMASVALISASPGIECANVCPVKEPINPEVMFPSMEEFLLSFLDSDS
ncbi:hypothetical protein CRG98_035276 [Punica granatum]|uniref:Uncharacterized protein n=1 Tax=Punica granatum TaxID=22663 RepID=A0A2I0IK19_PUNGR|nr:hypothetical protein CRG98_035276 [Punica granatum]